MYIPKNLVAFSSQSFPTLCIAVLLIDTFNPVMLHCCWNGIIIVYLVFVGFRDSLLAQNH